MKKRVNITLDIEALEASRSIIYGCDLTLSTLINLMLLHIAETKQIPFTFTDKDHR